MSKKHELLKNASWLNCPKPNDIVTPQVTIGWGIGESSQFDPIKDTNGSPIFRKTFVCQKSSRVSITATSLGIFDLWCNGKRVGFKGSDGETVYDELKPGWTDFNKRVHAYTYDLSDYIQEGENILVAALGTGWWSGHIAHNAYGNKDMAFIAEITVDGKKIPTDESWLYTWGGRVRASDIYDGELYNANYPSYADMSLPIFNCENWMPAEIVSDEYKNIQITELQGPAVRVRKGLDRSPEKIVIYEGTRDNGSDFGEINVVAEYNNTDSFVLKCGQKAVVDFGQEVVGWPEISLHTEKDATVCMRASEFLNDSGLKSRGNDGPSGSVYTVNYRSAKAKAYYVAAGAEKSESYAPTFTFFGFRYFEISADKNVEIKSIVAKVVGSDIEEVGKIETSHPMLNKLISNIIWGQRGNFLFVPTDCPQRDERLGWTGDTQIFCNTAAYNANVNSFFKKWLTDARDSQNEAGMFSDIIPAEPLLVASGGSAWADAPLIVAHVMWKMYGDTDIIKENFEAFEKYMAWLETRGFEGGNHHYGDWLAYEATDSKYISKTYYAFDAWLMAGMAKSIGLMDKSEKYMRLYEDIRQNFAKECCGADGDLLPELRTQTGYLLALKMKLLEGEAEEKAIAALAKKIKDNGYKLSTGFVGTGIINKTLASVGLNDLAYSLLLQTADPSWFYSICQGATTIWERWNSYTLERGFGDVGMNSFNHYAYGAVQEWMYRYMAGIEVDVDHPGFERVILQPSPDTREFIPEGQDRITWVKASYISRNGKIESEWSLSQKFVYNATTPVEATLRLPIVNGAENFTLNGKTFEISKCKVENGRIVMPLSAGKYTVEM